MQLRLSLQLRPAEHARCVACRWKIPACSHHCVVSCSLLIMQCSLSDQKGASGNLPDIGHQASAIGPVPQAMDPLVLCAPANAPTMLQVAKPPLRLSAVPSGVQRSPLSMMITDDVGPAQNSMTVEALRAAQAHAVGVVGRVGQIFWPAPTASEAASCRGCACRCRTPQPHGRVQ